MAIPEIGPREVDSPDAVIGERVRLWQFRRHVTQKQLAEVLGMKPAGVSRRLSGQTGWTSTDLVRVAAFLDVNLTDLLPEVLVEWERRRRGGENSAPGVVSTSAEPRRARRDSNPQPSDPKLAGTVLDLDAYRVGHQLKYVS